MKSERQVRSRLLIYPRFQLVLLAAQTAFFVLFGAGVAFQLHRGYARLLAMGHDAGLAPAHPYFKFVAFQANEIYTYLAVALAAGVTLSALFMLALSNRVAGPIVRMREYLKRVGAQGGTQGEQLKFRDGDFFDDLPETVNSTLRSLEGGARGEEQDGRKAS